MKNELMPGFDRGFSGLITDLDQRGMLDETLVVVLSEHGRTPKINKAKGGGRDHWSQAYSALFAGGGIARGKVVGKTDTHRRHRGRPPGLAEGRAGDDVPPARHRPGDDARRPHRPPDAAGAEGGWCRRCWGRRKNERLSTPGEPSALATGARPLPGTPTPVANASAHPEAHFFQLALQQATHFAYSLVPLKHGRKLIGDKEVPVIPAPIDNYVQHSRVLERLCSSGSPKKSRWTSPSSRRESSIPMESWTCDLHRGRVRTGHSRERHHQRENGLHSQDGARYIDAGE